MTSKLTRHVTKHEAAHAVVARKLGINVPTVTARKVSDAYAASASAWYIVAESDDMVAKITACEKDAIVALAGIVVDLDAGLPVMPDIITSQEADAANARSAIFRLEMLRSGRSPPREAMSIDVALHRATFEKVEQTYFRLLHKTKALVAQHQSAILRVAKHLERHPHITEDELDDLIERGERVPQSTPPRP